MHSTTALQSNPILALVLDFVLVATIRQSDHHSKTAKVPRRPFEAPRLDAELKLAGEYGLKNKREIWRIALTLSKIRRAARELLKLEDKDPKRLFEGNALIRCVVVLVVVVRSMGSSCASASRCVDRCSQY